MKKSITILSVIFFFSFPEVFSQEHSPLKHALVVGISNYSPLSGFRHIDADNDLMIILKVLQQQGFSDTIVLRDEQANKDGFIRAFNKLRSRVKPGDVVFIHFSTHGQQIEDLDGDEADGLDEAIALYDSKTTGANGYKGQNHLIDDEFGTMMQSLRKDLGKAGDIMVMVDACHSGSMCRGLDTAIIRGGYPPIMFSENEPAVKTRGGYNPVGIKNKTDKGLVQTKHTGMFSGLNTGKNDTLANYVIFSACENNEVSSEYYYNHSYFGPLTWAFLNSLLNNNSEKYTYNRLFHDIQYEMISMFENYKTKQNPTIESSETEGLDKIIFGGKSVSQQHFYSIARFITPEKIVIDGGNISGIFDSTTIKVFPSGTPDPDHAGNPVSTGIVLQTGYMESIVHLASPLNDKKPGDYWIFIADRKFNQSMIRINLGTFSNPELKKNVSNVLHDCRFAEVTADTPSYYLEQKKNTENELALVQGRSKKTYKDKITLPDLKKTLLHLAQVQFLKEMHASSPGIDLEVSFLPADTVHFSKSAFLDRMTLRNTFQEGIDTAILWIENTGKKTVYFNVIDIDPEDNFSVIVPGTQRPLTECILKPGQKYRASFSFNKPYGTETLKIVSSEKKFDLRPVINYADKTRSVTGDIENLFSGTYEMRGAPSLPESAELATFNLFFDVIKKK